MKYTEPKCTLDTMIMDATGFMDDYVKKFIVWVSREQWGWEETPTWVKELEAKS